MQHVIEQTVRPIVVVPSTGDAWLNVKQVAAALGIGVSTVWARVKEDPEFPRPHKAGPRLTRWKASSLRGYMANVERRGTFQEAA